MDDLLEELRQRAEARLPRIYADYIAGGAGQEHTVRDNVEAWKRFRLVPHVLRDVSAVALETVILGRRVDHPLMVAPMGYHGLFASGGERATAEGAAAAGAGMVLPIRSTVALEDVADVSGRPPWFQVYMHPERSWVADLLARVVASGYEALVLTVDIPVRGHRGRDARNTFAVPDDLDLPHLPPPEVHGHAARYDVAFDPAMTPETIEWLRDRSGLPVIVKGVLRPDDARGCLAAGAAGVVVSNHGGRQLDTTLSTADALRAVAEEVGEDGEVFVDGGLRSGVDVAKALALGARGVMVGRPVLWGLSVDGASGVAGVLDRYVRDLRTAMALLGARRVEELEADLLLREPLTHPVI